MTLTYLLFLIAPLGVAPPRTFSLLPSLVTFLAHGRCIRIWVLIIYQFFYLSLSFRYSPQRAFSFQFSKSSLGWLCFLLRLSLSFCREILVFFPFLCCYSFYLSGTKCGQIFRSFRSHQTPSQCLVVR